MTMSVSHRMKILIQTQYQRWKKCLEKIVGGIVMTGINLEVSEYVYLKLSEKAGKAKMSIGDYCAGVVGRSLDRDEELETLKEQLKTISARNVELLNEIEEFEEEIKDVQPDSEEKEPE